MKRKNVLLECAFFSPLVYHRSRTSSWPAYRCVSTVSERGKLIRRCSTKRWNVRPGLLIDICGGEAGPVDVTNENTSAEARDHYLRRSKLIA